MTDKKNIDIKSVEMAKVEDMVLDISCCAVYVAFCARSAYMCREDYMAK